MPVRIAINGFDRIGRNVLRSALIGGRTDLDLVAINDLTDAATLAHLFEFDSVHGRFPDSVAVDGSAIVVGEERFEATGLVLVGTLRKNGWPRISPVEPFLPMGSFTRE